MCKETQFKHGKFKSHENQKLTPKEDAPYKEKIYSKIGNWINSSNLTKHLYCELSNPQAY